MTYTAPSVQYCPTLDGTYTVLTGVQSVSINRGRKKATDPFVGSTCVIEFIPPPTFAVELALGQFLDVRQTNSATADAYFCGRITDIRRVYAMPYDDVTGQAPSDRIILTCSGATGQLAASQLTDYPVTGSSSTIQLGAIAVNDGLTHLTQNVKDKTAQSFTYTGGAFDLYNQIVRNIQAYVDDLDTQRTPFGTLSLTNGLAAYVPDYAVRTDLDDLGADVYVGLEFLSSAEQSFNEITVTANNKTAQTVKTASGPYNSLVYSTTLNNESDMLNLAQYILAFNQELTAVPISVSLSSTNNTLINRFAELKTFPATSLNFFVLGSLVVINFRFQQFFAQVQGVETFYGIQQSRQTVYFSANLGQPFTLNRDSVGVLDQNRLGF